ncbi:RNA polymerase sigma-70 factor (ECF subfamily) [Devosia sp. UYZn731]
MLRPELHRYASRMVGSAVDGEDVVQDALLSALVAFDTVGPKGDDRPWLFRIVHNAAIDYLRKRQRRERTVALVQREIASDGSELNDKVASRAALSLFMLLTPTERAAVILSDVFSYSNNESAAILQTSLAALKAGLHRGRIKLRRLADSPKPERSLDDREQARLRRFVDLFNAHEFDAIRAMLSHDVRFELVSQFSGDRLSFAAYFTRYADMTDRQLAIGTIDGQLAVLVVRTDIPADTPNSLILIDWAEEQIIRLRDYSHARYVLTGASIFRLA